MLFSKLCTVVSAASKFLFSCPCEYVSSSCSCVCTYVCTLLYCHTYCAKLAAHMCFFSLMLFSET